MRARLLLAALCAFLASLNARHVVAQSEFRQSQFEESATGERQLGVTFGIEHASGDYGTGSSTDVLYFPVTAWMWHGRSMVQLTVPYIRVTAPADGAAVDIGRMGRPIHGGSSSRTITESGLGDIEAGYRGILLDDLASGSRLDAVAMVKVGTADETRLLGTGENDYWVELDAFKTVGRLTWLAALGYRVYGNPPGVDLRDIWFASAGVWMRHGDADDFGVIGNFGQPIAAAGDPQKELRLYWQRATAGPWRLVAYVLAGTGNSSPEHGLGLLVTRIY